MNLLKILFEDDTMLVIEKPAGIDIEELQKFLPAGSLPSHRLDKETSGVLLVAKTTEALDFFHKQFKERKVEKKYICLVVGSIKDETGRVETLLGRAPGDRRKQKVFLPGEPGLGEKREAVSEYRVLKRYKDYTLLEIQPKTGRKHQIRAQFASLNHPVAGDKLYGFKDQKIPEGLKRHFLHASYLKISTPNGTQKEFSSELPKDLQNVIETINHAD
ncbi:MAG: RluA family pseudouridine synthase [Candidatus Wildermuthbacteria bacterium]|nr:RluA family pseudouridine synthase [Candidatus Wildermuthbacteria bacterium]